MDTYRMAGLARIMRVILLLSALLAVAVPVWVGFHPTATPGLTQALADARQFSNGQDQETLALERLAPLAMRLTLAATLAIMVLPGIMVLVRAAQALGPSSRGDLFDPDAARLFRAAAFWCFASLAAGALGCIALDSLVNFIVTGVRSSIVIKLGLSTQGITSALLGLALLWIAGLMDHGVQLQNWRSRVEG